MTKMTRFLASFLSFLFFGAVALTVVMLFVIWHYESDLPDYLQLSDYKPSITTRLYAGDGSLLAEYAIEKRIFVPVADMPDKLTEAFIAAEDKNFYKHGGIDYSGLARAVITNIKNYGTGRRLVGASTITQQVEKLFAYQ
jgi:penicillin-binding protein 1A